MDAMDEGGFSEAVELALGAVIFENWLRFHFIREKDGFAIISVPENGMALISELHPRYLPLAKILDGQPVVFERSREAVCRFAMQLLDSLDAEKKASGGSDLALAVFESRQFRLRLQNFSEWFGAAHKLLERGFTDFNRWLELFSAWERGIRHD